MNSEALYASNTALVTSQCHLVMEIGRRRHVCDREGHYSFSDQTTLYVESTDKREIVETRICHARDERFENLRAHRRDALFLFASERGIPAGYWNPRRVALFSNIRQRDRSLR
jgi:hypothetical protein